MPDYNPIREMITDGLGQFDRRELTQSQAREMDRACDKFLDSRGIKANKFFTWPSHHINKQKGKE